MQRRNSQHYSHHQNHLQKRLKVGNAKHMHQSKKITGTQCNINALNQAMAIFVIVEVSTEGSHLTKCTEAALRILSLLSLLRHLSPVW